MSRHTPTGRRTEPNEPSYDDGSLHPEASAGGLASGTDRNHPLAYEPAFEQDIAHDADADPQAEPHANAYSSQIGQTPVPPAGLVAAPRGARPAALAIAGAMLLALVLVLVIVQLRN